MKHFCIAVTGVVAALVAGVSSGAGVAHADAWSDEVLARHNHARENYGAPPLTWNSDLYASTLQFARQCKFQASEAGGQYGENLYAGTSSTMGIHDAMRTWMNEGSKYNYSNPGLSAGTRHFTQVVWKSTTQVTAAIADCPAGTIYDQPSKFIVARYTPPGNLEGRFPQNVGRRV
ncbi:CAP family protein [Nocardia fusca]|uniref:CAP family protein n=1 Tax=Nocardia fusca TaxID=941183 RepID=A0ABV3FKC6_9NOCA